MTWRKWLLFALLTLLWAKPAAADNRFIVRSNLGASGLSAAVSTLCGVVLGCNVVPGLDGTLGQLYLVTTPGTINPATFLSLLQSTPGILGAELDQLISMVGGQNQVPSPAPVAVLSDTTPVNYFGATVWNAYASQPAATIVHVSGAHGLGLVGKGIVADIDSGVDPNHPALKSVLLLGFDFTRNQPGGSELTDFAALPPVPCAPTPCPIWQPVVVNQSSMAIVDQSSMAIVDGNAQYAAFGHGTMVMGVIHLVAPQATLLPLKAFGSDGTGSLSNILRAIYFAVQNNAKVINMSFDMKPSSQELATALNYASQLGTIAMASAGNDGQQETVYPAGLTSTVMGVASTSDTDTRSSFSTFGPIVWVAAPGEAIVTTYPFNSYAAGWGTSFSAPFVSGTGALLVDKAANTNQSGAAAAVAHAQALSDPGMGNGRLDILQAVQALSPPAVNPDFTVSAAPSTAIVVAGQPANYTVSVGPVGAFSQTVTFSCAGAPAEATCSVSPSSVMLDGTNPVTVTLTVNTTARSVSAPGSRPRLVPPALPWVLVTACAAWLLVWAMLYSLRQASRRRFGLGAAAAVLAALVCISCGSTGSGPTTPPQGTPPGSSTISVTGSGGSGAIQHTTPVGLLVK